MMVRVKVRASPYRAVKRGSVGKVIGRKFLNTTYETLKVEFKDGAVWSLYPDELEVLDNEEV